MKPQTLMVAIQCVSAQTKMIEREIEGDPSAHAAELEELLVSYDLAAQDLKASYEAARTESSGLPSYDSLVVS